MQQYWSLASARPALNPSQQRQQEQHSGNQIYTYTNVYTHIPTSMYIYIYVYTFHIYIYIYISTSEYGYVCIRARQGLGASGADHFSPGEGTARKGAPRQLRIQGPARSRV